MLGAAVGVPVGVTPGVALCVGDGVAVRTGLAVAFTVAAFFAAAARFAAACFAAAVAAASASSLPGGSIVAAGAVCINPLLEGDGLGDGLISDFGRTAGVVLLPDPVDANATPPAMTDSATSPEPRITAE